MELAYIPCIILSHRESFIKFVYIGYLASRFGNELTRSIGTAVTTCVDAVYIYEEFDFSLLLASMYLNAHSSLLLEDFNPIWYSLFQFGAKLCTTILHCRILMVSVF